MLQKLLDHSPDLQKLFLEGFSLEIIDEHLVVHDIPYVNSSKEIKRGKFVSTLNLAGDSTNPPETHVMYFIGEIPCNLDGTVIGAYRNSLKETKLSEKLTTNCTFSSKPESGKYANYYDKILSYCRIITHPAKAIDPTVTEKTFQVIEPGKDESVFNYLDTNSTRAEINPVSAKLAGLKIGIIGIGGTGSYILDHVSKTPVHEIHIFDEDEFLSHNAFRAPGAADVQTLRERKKKINYFTEIYSRLHRGIKAHPYNITTDNLDELSPLHFIFLSLDSGPAKKVIIEFLMGKGIPFIDTGIGIVNVNDSLTGHAKITLVTSGKRDHVFKRISFADTKDDDYGKNIQISDINALNASLAVIKWKKHYNYYHDLIKEHNTIYAISSCHLQDDDHNA